MSELVVAIDLLSKGYDVFRALSQSCSCDLIAVDGVSLMRIEVRTGSITTKGELKSALNANEFHRSDVLATVNREGTRIIYHPDVLSVSPNRIARRTP